VRTVGQLGELLECHARERVVAFLKQKDRRQADGGEPMRP
jgi:hypothetical protein